MRFSSTPVLPACTGYRIVRPVVGEVLEGVPLVDSHLVFTVHRYDRRTVPCQGDDCMFCDHGMPKEERIFLPMSLLSSGLDVIVDLPSSAHRQLFLGAEKNGSLNNCVLTLVRKNSNSGPILLRGTPRDLSTGASYPLVDPVPAVERITAQNVEFACQAIMAGKTGSKFSP